MSVTQKTLNSDIFSIFYNMLDSKLTDPLSSSRNKWIFSVFPESNINTIGYPIIIISPADTRHDYFTIAQKKDIITIRIEVYATAMVTADELLSDINFEIENYIPDLRCNNLFDIMQGETYTSFETRGGTRAHIRGTIWNMKMTFPKGANLRPKIEEINASGRIA